MNDTDMAPPIPVEGQRATYPHHNPKLSLAWNRAWSLMTAQDEQFLDGHDLAERAAVDVLVPVTVRNLLARAAKAGLLEQQFEPVTTNRGTRNRAFYRIKK